MDNTGFLRIRQAIKDLNLSLFIREQGNFFVSELFEKELGQNINEGINEGINNLYLFIKNNPSKRLSQIEQDISVPYKTLERWVKILKEENKIEYRGSKKTGGYYIKEEEK